MSKKFFVRCRVAAGIFGSEFYVIVGESSAYVSRRNVEVNNDPKDSEVEGRVRAYLITKEKDKALVELPGEPVVGGLRTWVPLDRLEAVG